MIELYDKDGKIIEDENKACAIKIVKELEDNVLGKGKIVTKYYVKYAGYLFDPVQMNEVDTRYRNWQMKEVGQRVFDIYMEFLKTKREFCRINAERLINV